LTREPAALFGEFRLRDFDGFASFVITTGRTDLVAGTGGMAMGAFGESNVPDAEMAAAVALR
jgi:hypothetical protein